MARSWRLTGVHGSPTTMRLADGHGPPLPAPDEQIEVIEIAEVERLRNALADVIEAARSVPVADRHRYGLAQAIAEIATRAARYEEGR